MADKNIFSLKNIEHLENIQKKDEGRTQEVKKELKSPQSIELDLSSDSDIQQPLERKFVENENESTIVVDQQTISDKLAKEVAKNTVLAEEFDEKLGDFDFSSILNTEEKLQAEEMAKNLFNNLPTEESCDEEISEQDRRENQIEEKSEAKPIVEQSLFQQPQFNIDGKAEKLNDDNKKNTEKKYAEQLELATPLQMQSDKKLPNLRNSIENILHKKPQSKPQLVQKKVQLPPPQQDAVQFQSNIGTVGTTTHFDFAQSDSYLERRKLIVLISILVCCSAMAYLTLINPEFAAKAVTQVKEIMDPYQQYLDEDSDDSAGVSIEKKSNKNIALDKRASHCKHVIRENFVESQKAKLKPDERLRLSSCLIADEAFGAANKELMGYKNTIKKLSEEQINKDLTLQLPYILIAHLLLKQGNFDEATKFASHRCRNIAFNVSCVVKLYVDSVTMKDPKITVNFQKLYNENKQRLEKKDILTALFYYTGGVLKTNSKKITSSGDFFQLSIQQLPSKQEWLYRSIVEQMAFQYYNSRNSTSLKALIKSYESNLVTINDHAKWKLMLMLDLITNKNPKKTLSSFYSNPEFMNAIKQDFNFAILLAVPTLIHKQEKAFIIMINSIIAANKNQGNKTQQLLQKLNEWLARAYISLEDYNTALNYLQNNGVNLIEYAHLSGICYLYLNDDHDQAGVIAASKSFKKAAEQKMNWQSLYGLGYALVQAKQYKSAKKIIESFPVHASTNSSKIWGSYLEIQYLMAIKNNEPALEIVNKVLSKYPNSIYAWELKSQLLTTMKKTEENEVVLKKLNELYKNVEILTDQAVNSPVSAFSVLAIQ